MEGELPEDGLAEGGEGGDDNGGDPMLARARQIVSGEEAEDGTSVEQVFAQARCAEASAEVFPVDDGRLTIADCWKAAESEPEPEPVVVAVRAKGNGRRGGVASQSPLPRSCSSGRSTQSRSERRSRSARGAGPQIHRSSDRRNATAAPVRHVRGPFCVSGRPPIRACRSSMWERYPEYRPHGRANSFRRMPGRSGNSHTAFRLSWALGRGGRLR